MDGQLNKEERKILTDRIKNLKPDHVLEVGTWLGGGSTLHILRAMQENNKGHLWGIEAAQDIYDQMISNIRSAGDDLVARFTPVFGFSQNVIPQTLQEIGDTSDMTLVFLDGGDNPLEQIDEFRLLNEHMPVGAILLSHDAKLRKGKWLVPYLNCLDNWECTLHDISAEGLFEAKKLADTPSDQSIRNASNCLKRLRREPAELIGRIMPSWCIGIIAKMLPIKLVRKLSQGRN